MSAGNQNRPGYLRHRYGGVSSIAQTQNQGLAGGGREVFVAGQDFAIERRWCQDGEAGRTVEAGKTERNARRRGEAGPHGSKKERRRSPPVWRSRRSAAKGHREKKVMAQKRYVPSCKETSVRGDAATWEGIL